MPNGKVNAKPFRRRNNTFQYVVPVKVIRTVTTLYFSLTETRDADGSYTSKEYCPIDGQFSVQYKINDEYNNSNCTERNTTIDTCPSGSTLNLRLNSCRQNYGRYFSFASTSFAVQKQKGRFLSLINADGQNHKSIVHFDMVVITIFFF